MAMSDEERRSSYYISCQEYVYGESPSVPSPIRKHFRRQDESPCGISSTRARQNRKQGLEELVNRLIALEQEVYLNRQRTKVTVEEVNDESIWNNINFDEPAKFQTNYSFDEKVLDVGGPTRNHFDDDVFDDNEVEKVLDEEALDERERSTNQFDDDVLDLVDNEAKKVIIPYIYDIIC
uniref:Uncharacterized protein n=1 Tax=Lactuca sativa TaxID=4236 RepID=A0A9R1WYI8_LACSA|nr:hypothetical protein LSAT_V11C800443970 [Lactuca sativa]